MGDACGGTLKNSGQFYGSFSGVVWQIRGDLELPWKMSAHTRFLRQIRRIQRHLKTSVNHQGILQIPLSIVLYNSDDNIVSVCDTDVIKVELQYGLRQLQIS